MKAEQQCLQENDSTLIPSVQTENRGEISDQIDGCIMIQAAQVKITAIFLNILKLSIPDHSLSLSLSCVCRCVRVCICMHLPCQKCKTAVSINFGLSILSEPEQWNVINLT